MNEVEDAIASQLAPTALTTTAEMAQAVLRALRSLPVEQRMEAMGMVRGDVAIGGRGDENHIEWEPSEIGDYWREAEA